MKEPVIGILGDTMRHHTAAFGDVGKHYVNQKYVSAVEKNGGIPLILPVSGDLDRLRITLPLCDGLLLPGGEDVDPSLYGEGPHRCLGMIQPTHDRFLLSALNLAAEMSLPCLGICKGMQMMAVYSGGTLYQDIYSQLQSEVLLHCQHGCRDYPVHQVSVKPDSHLYQLLGQERLNVNSMHHQSVRTLGKSMAVSALADDGIIEAIESSDGLMIGVQWHPEELTETMEIMNRLFADLAERAAKRRSQR